MVAPAAPAPGLQARSIKLKGLSAQAWRAFKIKFPAVLGPCLAETLRKSLQGGIFHPADPRHARLHEHINDALTIALDDFDDLLIE